MNIIIYGTGSTAEMVLGKIKTDVTIVAVADGNKEKWNKSWNGFTIINPFNITNYQYDYIIICSIFTKEIVENLIRIGVDRSKIIPYFNNLYTELDRQVEINILNKIMKLQTSDNKIALLTRGNSGCNCRALYKNIPDEIRVNYDVELIDSEKIYSIGINNYKIVFSTHLEGTINSHSKERNNINIETWHGFPIKKIGVLEKNSDFIADVNESIDYVVSYSDLYSYIFSSIYKVDINKFCVTGMPRNDLLNNKNAKEYLARIVNCDIGDSTILFYVPTFRKRKYKDTEGDIVLFSDKEWKILNQFLVNNNSYLVVKKHPLESINITKTDFENIFFIEDEDLKNEDIDFYEILGASDLLITDYSSVYFDYLLLNKPIIFWTRDINIYRKNRGFLFDNIEAMMPGPILQDIDDFLMAIDKSLSDSSWYSNERNHIKKMVHRYDDFQSSKRVWRFLLEKMII